MDMEPIGVVRSPVMDAVDQGWGEVVSEIHLRPELAPGLTGLNEFSHILVVFLMHRSSWDQKSDLVRRPQGRDDMPLVGIFAQRAKHRPNPVGITAAKILSVKDNVIRVLGLDAIDDTPVIDLKPYFPAFDRVDQAKVPDWVDRLMKDYF